MLKLILSSERSLTGRSISIGEGSELNPISSNHFLETTTFPLEPRWPTRSTSLTLVKLVDPAGRPRLRLVLFFMTAEVYHRNHKLVNTKLTKNSFKYNARKLLFNYRNKRKDMNDYERPRKASKASQTYCFIWYEKSIASSSGHQTSTA